VDRIVVVGGGLAGIRSAEALRRGGYSGQLTLVGEETHFPPYDRPPLSKQLLAGTWDIDRVLLRVEDGLELDLKLGRRATSLDTRAKRLTLDGGEELTYDGLVIATGATPRHLPAAADHGGVFVLRTLEDCLALRKALAGSPRVAVVGAGFIGCEVAATCRQLGLDVTIVEFLPLPLVRVVGPVIGEVCATLHRDHGVKLVLGVGVAGVEGHTQVERLSLADGTSVDADVVVVGIGVSPCTEWLEGSGLTLDNGIVCDETCTAVGAEGVVATGDIARWPNKRFGQVMRIEHWTNAAEQAEAAAAALLAGPAKAEPFTPIPYFWSDQYDVKFASVGMIGPDDDVEIVEGSVDDRKFVATYSRAGALVGAFACNHPRALMQLRTQIEALTSPT
jgi:3-phenylpropionate/trans-cinnamate dioxygenase ferredoxin reductase subunit